MENETFGKLTIIKRNGANHRGDALYLCRCECGCEVTVKGANLRSGKTSSCGCMKTGPKRERLEGRRFGRWLVLSYIGRGTNRISMYECQCDCGCVKTISARSLKTGMSYSCGCYNSDQKADLKGEKNPHYNPSLTEEERERGRNIEGYDDWSRLVKERFNYTCDCCGLNKSGHMVSHHLEGYHSNPELRIVVYNGVCLCDECHKQYHKTMGYRNSTEEKYLEFKRSMYGRMESSETSGRGISSPSS